MYRVLVCDDDEAIVRSIEIYLKAEGYETVSAYNGKQALEKLEKEEVQCVIMDIMMPVMDGISATLKIREKSNIPIIFLSAKSNPDPVSGLQHFCCSVVGFPLNFQRQDDRYEI